MARIRLASWYDGGAPGDVVEVPDEALRPLTRDGRVAEVLTAAEPEPETAREASVSAEPPPEPPQIGRRSRRSST